MTNEDIKYCFKTYLHILYLDSYNLFSHEMVSFFYVSHQQWFQEFLYVYFYFIELLYTIYITDLLNIYNIFDHYNEAKPIQKCFLLYFWYLNFILVKSVIRFKDINCLMLCNLNLCKVKFFIHLIQHLYLKF